MQNSHKNSTNVYYCQRHEDLVIDEKTYTMAKYFPYFGKFAYDVKYLVLITKEKKEDDYE